MSRTGLLAGACALGALGWLAGGPSSEPSPADAVTPADAPSPPGAVPPRLVLGPDGVVRAWAAGDAALGPLPDSLAQIGRTPVNDLAVSEDGGRIVALLASPPSAGGRQKRTEGIALVLSSPAGPEPPRVLTEISFQGEGRRVVTSEDGRLACVLAFRAAGEKGTATMRTWIHALDLEAGTVAASTRLDRPPGPIALDPRGARLYLSYAGRIVSYTTRPLARSWHYRSPAQNRALSFRPRTPILFAVRRGEVAVFDPGIIAARKPEERLRLEDDATAVIPLPFAADSLLFSRDGLMAAALGPGRSVAFIDPDGATVMAHVADEAGADSGEEVRPFSFAAGPGDLAVAVFPGRTVEIIHPPSLPAPAVVAREASASPSGQASENSPDIQETESKHGPDIPREESTVLIDEPGSAGPPPSPISTLAPPATARPVETSPASPAPSADQPAPAPRAPATPAPTAAPAGSLPARPSGEARLLAGRLTGQIGAVRAVVLYGPGSIVREQARVAPASDGSWTIPLPPPGTYRVVPLGEASRPLRAEPNFHTVEVMDGGVAGLDFRILGAV